MCWIKYRFPSRPSFSLDLTQNDQDVYDGRQMALTRKFRSLTWFVALRFCDPSNNLPQGIGSVNQFFSRRKGGQSWPHRLIGCDIDVRKSIYLTRKHGPEGIKISSLSRVLEFDWMLFVKRKSGRTELEKLCEKDLYSVPLNIWGYTD